MIPISPVRVDIKPEKSCNDWKCCFGWICCEKKKLFTADPADSPVSMEITERVTRTYERHRHSTSPSVAPKRISAPSLEKMEEDTKG